MTSLQFNPPVIAHRGASGYAPENTMIAFMKAVDLGVKWVEFDVLPSRDGIAIVFHDDTLSRTTDGEGSVYEADYPYLQTLDAGKWFNPIFSGERIPTLEAVLSFLQEAHMNANIEIKTLPNQEESFVRQLLSITNAFENAQSSYLFSSFDFETLRQLRRLDAECQIGLLLHEWLPNWEAKSEDIDCLSVHINDEIVRKSDVVKIKQAGKKVLVYTVNDLNRFKQLRSWGVDAVFSDYPDQLLRLHEE